MNRLWIENNFGGPVKEDFLTSVHGECPQGFDPLVGLQENLEEMPPEDQLYELSRKFRACVLRGYGLMLTMCDPRQLTSAAEWRLREVTEDMIRSSRKDLAGDLSRGASELYQDYLADEALLVWACQRLDWPADWTLEYLRNEGLLSYASGPASRSRFIRLMPLDTKSYELIPPKHVLEGTPEDKRGWVKQIYREINRDRSAIVSYVVSEGQANLARDIRRQLENLQTQGVAEDEGLASIKLDLEARERALQDLIEDLDIPFEALEF